MCIRDSPVAVIVLWAMTAFFAFCAVLIPLVGNSVGSLIVGAALVLWAALFIAFIKTADK